MIVGVPKEIKRDEYRIGILPVGVEELVRAGHQVLVEQGAGLGSGLADNVYEKHGAETVATHDEVFERADMIVKVKEPLPPEWPLLRRDQVVFTYFHFAADRKLTEEHRSLQRWPLPLLRGLWQRDEQRVRDRHA